MFTKEVMNQDKCYQRFSECVASCEWSTDPTCSKDKACRYKYRDCLHTSSAADFARARYDMARQNGVSHETALSALPESLTG